MSLKRLRSYLGSLRGGTAAPLPLSARIKAYRHGFSAWNWLLYDLDNADPAEFVPDSASKRLERLDGPAVREIFRNKLLFEYVMRSHARVPRSFGIIDRGIYAPLVEEAEFMTIAGVLDWCDGRPGVIIKPVASSEGRNVHSVEVVDGRILLDKRPAQRSDVMSLVHGFTGGMVSELLRQGTFGERVFPDAANTIRVVTMIDPLDGEPFVLAAVHRFGTKKSAPSDNIARGAIRSDIDLASGRLSMPSASWAFKNGKFSQFPQHPDTGTQIEGEIVPGFDAVKESLLAVLRRFPNFIYVGWDVLVGEREICFLEANHSPSLATQLMGGYLKDPRAKRVLTHYGIVR